MQETNWWLPREGDGKELGEQYILWVVLRTEKQTTGLLRWATILAARASQLKLVTVFSSIVTSELDLHWTINTDILKKCFAAGNIHMITEESTPQ